MTDSERVAVPATGARRGMVIPGTLDNERHLRGYRVGQVEVRVQVQFHAGNGPCPCHGNGPYPWARTA